MNDVFRLVARGQVVKIIERVTISRYVFKRISTKDFIDEDNTQCLETNFLQD